VVSSADAGPQAFCKLVLQKASMIVRAWRPLLTLALLLASGGCAARRSAPPLFSTPFGVTLGDAPVTAAQLDALGPVWYMDWQWRTATLARHERLYVVWCSDVETDQGQIPAAMRASGAAWWSLGNEPNDPNQDYRTPEAYAELYHQYEGWADKAPRCGILPAGIANADWEWAAAFRDAYRDRYGRYPRTDGWNIHNYILEPGLDPYDVTEFGRRILAFRSWMESIGDGDKPLFLTEFGVLYGTGCCDRPVDAPEKVEAFMRQAVQWLQDSGAVSGWAWCATYTRLYNGSLMTPAGELNSLGQTYSELVKIPNQSLR
jgi:hypothetical protein